MNTQSTVTGDWWRSEVAKIFADICKNIFKYWEKIFLIHSVVNYHKAQNVSWSNNGVKRFIKIVL